MKDKIFLVSVALIVHISSCKSPKRWFYESEDTLKYNVMNEDTCKEDLILSVSQRDSANVIILEFKNPTNCYKQLFYTPHNRKAQIKSIPAEVNLLVRDSTRKFLTNFSWLTYADPYVSSKMYPKQKVLYIDPNSNYFKKEVAIWWPGMEKGKYFLSAEYSNSNQKSVILKSNEIEFKVSN